MKKDQTKVMFRIFNGEVVALFPEIASDMNPANCQSYAHMGQHCGANYGNVMRYSKPAKPEQFKELAAELKSVGYDLHIIQKTNAHTYRKRAEYLKNFR